MSFAGVGSAVFNWIRSYIFRFRLVSLNALYLISPDSVFNSTLSEQPKKKLNVEKSDSSLHQYNHRIDFLGGGKVKGRRAEIFNAVRKAGQ